MVTLTFIVMVMMMVIMMIAAAILDPHHMEGYLNVPPSLMRPQDPDD